MKFFVVTSLKEYKDDVCRIFKDASISVYSATEVIGFKKSPAGSLIADWFASGDEQFDSLLIFSFTSTENAEKGMELIKAFNAAVETQFPIRAFIMPVEAASY